MRGKGKEVFEMRLDVKDKKGVWVKKGKKTKGVFNLLYNKRSHLCSKSPIIRYLKQPSIWWNI